MAKYGPTKFYERIDLICANHYGSSGNDVVMFVIESNPGIEQYGLLLPPGVTLELPKRKDITPSSVVRQQIFLWD